MATSTRWPATIRSGMVSKITDMNVVLLLPPLNLATSLLNRNPSVTPTASPMKSRGIDIKAQSNPSRPNAINMPSDAIVAKIAAAVTLRISCATIAIANPTTNGTRKKTTGPIALGWWPCDKKNPRSPKASPVKAPTSTPFSEAFQLYNELPPSASTTLVPRRFSVTN